jgi:hypothetical protein
MMPHSLKSPSRWLWTVPALAAAVVVACDSGFTDVTPDQHWGFVNVTASRAANGQHYTSPDAFFFFGTVSAVPNAQLVVDSCSPATFTSGNTLQDVTYLDAGSPVTTLLGARLDTLPRNVGTAGTTYKKPAGAEIPYTPGDSIVVSVPGSVGGFPAAEIRARTAEAFAVEPVAMPTGTNAIQLRWTRSTDFNSAMIVSLRYSAPGSSGQLNRQILCAFTDDGVDSITFRQYEPWLTNNGLLSDLYLTRLRTVFQAVPDGLLEVISTYQVPTPER